MIILTERHKSPNAIVQYSPEFSCHRSKPPLQMAATDEALLVSIPNPLGG